MVFSSTFVSTVTSNKYYIRGNFTCTSTDVIYLVEYINCKCQYVGSTTYFKQRFRIHKPDIKTKKVCCGTAGNLILFDAIQRFHCIYASVYTRCVARPNQASMGEFFCEYSRQLFSQKHFVLYTALLLLCNCLHFKHLNHLLFNAFNLCSF